MSKKWCVEIYDILQSLTSLNAAITVIVHIEWLEIALYQLPCYFWFKRGQTFGSGINSFFLPLHSITLLSVFDIIKSPARQFFQITFFCQNGTFKIYKFYVADNLREKWRQTNYLVLWCTPWEGLELLWWWGHYHPHHYHPFLITMYWLCHHHLMMT